MAGAYKDDDDDAITNINVTPFVDILLVLLVVFMVTAKLIVARGVEIDKPKAATGGAVQSTLRVTVTKEGDLYINKDKFTDDTAAIAKLKQLTAGVDKPKALINGSRSGAYGNVMRAIDVVQQAGIKGIALENMPLDDK
jgi:biopolymer transport protein TolR